MKILMPVDGSAFSELAVDFVASRAVTLEQAPTIELFHVQAPLPKMPRGTVDRDALRRHLAKASSEILDPLEDALAAVGVPARLRTEIGLPGQVIAARAEAMDADLVVMGSHGRTALRELVLGSMTQVVLALTRRPVLVLRGPRRPHRRSLRIGVAVDGSNASRAALSAMIENAAFFGPRATVALICAQGPPPYFLETMAGIASSEIARPSNATELIMAPVRAMAAQAGIVAREVVLQGWPETELPRYARKNLDVLAMGRTGRSKLSRAVLGSVTARVAARCDVPLLLAPG